MAWWEREEFSQHPTTGEWARTAETVRSYDTSDEVDGMGKSALPTDGEISVPLEFNLTVKKPEDGKKEYPWQGGGEHPTAGLA